MLLADEVATYYPVLSDNPYQPHMARIVRIYKMVENNYLFTLRFLEDQLAHSFRHQPGQFIMLSVPGAGEIPISISSSPSSKIGWPVDGCVAVLTATASVRMLRSMRSAMSKH